MKSLLTVALLVFALLLARYEKRENPQFVLNNTVVTNQVPTNSSGFFPKISDAPSVHAPSICEGDEGTMFAVWWGGSREGAKDVRIFFSRMATNETSWSAPRVVMSRELASDQLRLHIRRIGNAIIFSRGNGDLRILFTTTSIGGWSTATLNLMRSYDKGATWERAEKLELSPFLNISELAKNPAVRMTDGAFLVPIYHELAGKFSEALWLREPKNKVRVEKTRINSGRSAFQPSIAPTGPDSAVCMARDTGEARRIWISRTTDRGRSWSAPEKTDLPNPNAGVDVTRLNDGRLLLAFNDAEKGRENLTLALSSDDGATWKRVRVVDQEPGGEFSYPTLCVTRHGTIHLVYTWKREAIRHLTFNSAWLEN